MKPINVPLLLLERMLAGKKMCRMEAQREVSRNLRRELAMEDFYDGKKKVSYRRDKSKSRYDSLVESGDQLCSCAHVRMQPRNRGGYSRGCGRNLEMISSGDEMRIVIIGGGITGVCCAQELTQLASHSSHSSGTKIRIILISATETLKEVHLFPPACVSSSLLFPHDFYLRHFYSSCR
jgi:hypothetical protein